jgi:signal transduction histidine kinase/ligand-binding sensor domain-containing protein
MASRRRLLLRVRRPRTTIAAALACHFTCIWLLAGSAHALDPNKRPNGQSHSPQYVATVWQTEQGLPVNSVQAMVQDREGYLWLATNGGLARFDGVRFRVFGGEDFPSLQSSRFQSLYASRSGELWIGTRNGGLIRLHDGIVTTYLERDGLPNRNIRSIREDAEGKLWINTISGIACCAGGKLQAYTTYRGKAISEFFLQARDGSMWFRSGMDVVRFGAAGSIATLAGGFIVQEARDGSVWVAFQHQSRLVRYHQGVFSDVPLPAAGVRHWTGADRWQGVAMAGDPRQAVLAMATDTDGELLMLMPAGLVRAVDGRLSPPEVLPLPANIGDVPKVLSLMVDREGNRWVGTVGRGLFRFRPAPLTAYGKDEGLSDSPFRAVFQDRDGRIWLGGDAAVYWFDGHHFHLVPGLAEIGTIAQTNDGDLWFGGSGAVYRWRSGVLTQFKIESPGVFQILQDREGTLWIVAPTYEQMWRLYRFREGKFEQIDADVVHMAEDRDGGLWLAGVNPPALRLARGGKTVLYDERRGMPPNGVHSFCQDPSGALWFATTTGLYRLRDGRFGAITARNGLTSEVTSILDDGKGNLWLPSEQGIFRFSLKEVNDIADGRISSISPISYRVAEGMKTSECNGGVPGACKARDGRLWFPTMRGVVAIDPNAVNGPPPVVVEEAWANKVTLGRDGRTLVPAGSDTFDFTFTALSLSAAEQQHFKYRLEPYDKDWVDAGTRRAAHYTNMAPGEYSFQVIAANSFGVWNNQGAGVRFVLQPHYYQANWFRALCTTVFFALLWAAYQLRVRHLHKQFDMTLEARVGERTRIARDLHDTLLQSFHGLAFRFQAARNMLPNRPEQAAQALDAALIRTEQALDESRHSIQGLRPSQSAENELDQMLITSGQELASSNHAEDGSPRFEVIVEGERRGLPPMITDEIGRIARELLRNAFRHAHAHEIEVEIRYENDVFRLIVRDDGKGMDPKILKDGGRAGHWGLPGVQERARGIGARLEFLSEAGAGTEIRLTIPAAIAYERPRNGDRFSLFRKRRIHEHQS